MGCRAIHALFRAESPQVGILADAAPVGFHSLASENPKGERAGKPDHLTITTEVATDGRLPFRDGQPVHQSDQTRMQNPQVLNPISLRLWLISEAYILPYLGHNGRVTA